MGLLQAGPRARAGQNTYVGKGNSPAITHTHFGAHPSDQNVQTLKQNLPQNYKHTFHLFKIHNFSVFSYYYSFHCNLPLIKYEVAVVVGVRIILTLACPRWERAVPTQALPPAAVNNLEVPCRPLRRWGQGRHLKVSV
jgi:hypothetical protein